MASNMSIKITSEKGEIKGEHQEKAGEIEVLTWQWSFSHPGTTHDGPGGGQGALSVADLSFTKPVDASSAHLLKMLCDGTHFKEAKLTIRKAGGEKSIDYLTITMKKGVVSSVVLSGTSGDERMTETVSLNFPEFHYEYVAQEPDGSPGSSVPMAFDIAKKKPL